MEKMESERRFIILGFFPPFLKEEGDFPPFFINVNFVATFHEKTCAKSDCLPTACNAFLKTVEKIAKKSNKKSCKIF